MLLKWLLEAWPMLYEVEMPELPWQMAGEGIKTLRGVSMLEKIIYVRLENLPTNYIPQKGPNNTPFSKAMRDVLVRKYQHQGGAQQGCCL